METACTSFCDFLSRGRKTKKLVQAIFIKDGLFRNIKSDQKEISYYPIILSYPIKFCTML